MTYSVLKVPLNPNQPTNQPPSNTMWPWPRPTCMPSFILIHPTVWSQYTNVTGSQDKRTGQTTVR